MTLPDERLSALDDRIRPLPGAVVAFSGGVDSTALLHAAVRSLGERVVAVTADSPSLPRSELEEAAALASEIGVEHQVLGTDELAREGYRKNASDRCYFCKAELFEVVARSLRGVAGRWPVLYGAIADDAADHRPGGTAAREHGVLAPLADAGFTKAEVRAYCRRFDLRVADKPSFACLSSRVPYGTSIDAALLQKLETAEQVLRDLGYRQFRVRHHDTVARVEVLPEDLPRAVGVDRDRLIDGIRAAGYHYVTLDLMGYRTGAMNEVLGAE